MIGERITDEEDGKIVQEILQRLDGLSSLMGDLLLYARPPRPQMRTVDLSGLFEALVPFLKSDPAWRGLNVTVDGSGGSLEGDPELLKIAFQNLLLNAAQAVRGQGHVHISLRDTGPTMVIEIADDGPGIAPEHQERLFTPFFTTKSRGTGLGLATVRRIAEAHGGDVSIPASGPQGTVVRVTLPTVQSRHPHLA